MIDSILLGFQEVAQWQVILALLIGAMAGILVGAVPGMEPAGAMAIALPFSLTMQPLPGIILLLGCYGGAWYGGAIPAILILAVSVAWARGVKVYEEFVDGAKEGFQVAVRIMPYLVAMLAVLAILRESGAFQLLEYLLAPLLNMLGFPVELLSLALMRPLSGSGAQGILNEILTRPDLSEMVKFTAGILYGSTETTFYVLTVYFGSVGIRRFRHALVAGLTADFIGMVAAVFFGRLLFAFT